MAATHCLNCDAAIARTGRFCAHCGQRTDTARLTVSDVVRDLTHSFVNIERSAFAFALALVLRPGRLAREYVDGRRRRYYGPFATLAVLVGATTLAINVAGFQVLAQDGLTGRPEDFLQRHFNLVLLAQLPLLGATCALLFRRARLNLCEHMVPVAYALSIRAVVIALAIPFSYATTRDHGLTQATVLAYWAAWYIYFGWVASQFYAGNRLELWIRGVAAAALAHAVIMAIIFSAASAYRMLFDSPPL
jgi:Protein of unknown function (DUF3667)